MTVSAWLGGIVLVLLGMILWSVWRLVRSPLPLEIRKALEEKEEQKISALKQEWADRLGQEVERVWKQFQHQLQTTDKSVGQRLEQVHRTFSEVKEELGRLKEATNQVEQVGRSVSSLQDLLRSPKMRGGIGEYFMADLLSQILPDGCYALQHEFADGERVDAVIRLREQMVPIDSKFPLEQFRKMGEAATDEERSRWRRALIRDVKLHIDSIAQKYIRPAEGTYNFALMYIPAENVYYETIVRGEGVADDQGIFQHAIRRQVIPVSPNSFYAYLMVILQGLRGFEIEKKARQILETLMRLQKELAGVREDFDRAGKQMHFAADNFDRAEKHLARFEERLGAIEAPAEGADALPPAPAANGGGGLREE